MTEGQSPAGVVIVAVDFSDASARAVALAGHIAHAWSARLIALHAETFDVPPYFTMDQVDRLEGERAALGAQAREYLSTFVATHTTTPAESLIESRVPAEAILHHADRAELVVMGTHGRRGPSRWWLGSVAERVLHDTPVPLLVVHVDSPVPSRLREITVHASGPATGNPALALALRLGRALGIAVRDLRGEPVTPESAESAGGTLRVVALPDPAHRRAVGSPLVRASSGAALFVPE
jgi:nucleotide-binding universal stress UspA family protein